MESPSEFPVIERRTKRATTRAGPGTASNAPSRPAGGLWAATALGDIARILSSASSERARIEEAVGALAAYVNADAAVFYQRSIVRGAAPLVYAHSLTPYTLEQMSGGDLQVRMEAFVNLVAVAGNVREAPIVDDAYFAREEGLRWAASFPVWSVGHVAGVLIFAWRCQSPMNAEATAVSEAAASLIGTAIRSDVELERGTELAVLRERARIARDIHDSVTQSVTAIVLNLEAAGRGDREISEATKTGIEASLSVARAALIELRRSIWNLRLGVGKVQSIAELLNAVTGSLQAAGIACDIQVHGSADSLSDELVAGLLSIARESLTNVLRHAGAARAEVLVNIGDDSVVMAITDNGIGATLPPGPASFGISGMRERAASFGGEVTIHAVAGLGTRVECVLPLLKE
jgi:signal transduction histidine kinase